MSTRTTGTSPPSGGMPPGRILLVLDHDLLAQGLAKVLGNDHVDVERRRTDLGAGVVDAVRDGGHHLVILDVDCWADPAGLDGLIAALGDLGTTVVAFASTAEAQRAALEGGAGGVIRADGPAGSLRRTVAEAVRGRG